MKKLYRAKREDFDEFFEGNYSYNSALDKHIITCTKGRIAYYIKVETLQVKEIGKEWINYTL
jgi:hypothetical protein